MWCVRGSLKKRLPLSCRRRSIATYWLGAAWPRCVVAWCVMESRVAPSRGSCEGVAPEPSQLGTDLGGSCLLGWLMGVFFAVAVLECVCVFLISQLDALPQNGMRSPPRCTQVESFPLVIDALVATSRRAVNPTATRTSDSGGTLYTLCIPF